MKMNIYKYIILYGGNYIINDYKYISKIFPKYKNTDLKKLKLTEESLYSVSKNKGALFTINKIIKHYGNKDLIITDGTANVGSDTINFGLIFNKVNAVEYNKINYNILKHNVKLYKLNNIITIYGDIIDIITNLYQDVIYIDAPWGGYEYKNKKNLKLYLNNTEISEFVINNLNKAKLFVLKVPYNYDFNYFLTNIKNNNIFIYPFIKNDNIKYYIIIIKTQ